KYKKGQVIALAGAFVLHAGIAAWAVAPSNAAILPQEQLIHVSLVAPSSVAKEQAAEQAEPAAGTPPKKQGLRKAGDKQKKQKKNAAMAEKPSPATPQTSGQVSPDATERNSAQTEPVFNAAYLRNPPPVYPESA